MSPKTRRSILQVLFLLLVLLAVAASDPHNSDWERRSYNCGAPTGSHHKKESYPTTQRDHLIQNQDGDLVLCYHDITTSDFTLTGKDLDYIREWLPGNVYVGLRIPTALEVSPKTPPGR